MAMRLVLDTNVWLDWLVFGDPAVAPLKAAVDAGEAEVFMAAACSQELARVLTHPLRKTTLDPSAQAACLDTCRRVVRWLDVSPVSAAAPLPICRDPDDQKFLELARDCGADILVTRDRALLVLARRKYQPLPFRVLTPQQFAGSMGSSAAGCEADCRERA